MNPLRWLLQTKRQHDDLAREMDAHIAERVDALVDDGMTETEARAQARREFGNVTVQTERSREIWIAPWLTSVWQDLRYAIRSFGRRPGFAIAVVGILSFAIGPVAAFFTVFNSQVLREWRVADPSTLAVVKARPAAGNEDDNLSYIEYRYLRDHTGGFSHLATWMGGGGGNVRYGEATMFVQGYFVSANYFDALRVTPVVGRTFTTDEENYRNPKAVAIISHLLWQRLGEPASIVGDTIHIEDVPFTVVGVVHAPLTDLDGRRDLWMPMPSGALIRGDSWLDDLANPRGGHATVFGRLKPGMTRGGAEAELDVLSRQFRASIPMDGHGISVHSTRPIDMRRANVVDDLPVMGLVLGALVLVLLISCANVGNLMLARGLSRQREVAIRIAMGAGRRRVVRQLVTEAMVPCVLAAALGFGLAMAVPRLMRRLVQDDPFGPLEQLSPDATVYGFLVTIAVLATAATGLLPALRSTERGLAARAGDRHSSTTGAGRLRTTLLAAQLALSMVLLVGAGLLTRAVGMALDSDPGFPIREVQILSPSPRTGTTPERHAAFLAGLHNAVGDSGVPVAMSEFVGIGRFGRSDVVRARGESVESSRGFLINAVSANYFEVLGIPLVAGRSLEDDASTAEVVISASAARYLGGIDDVIGRLIVVGRDATAREHVIVGVAHDIVMGAGSLDQTRRTPPTLYQPLTTARHFLTRDPSGVTMQQVVALARGLDSEVTLVPYPLSDRMRVVLSNLIAGSYFAWALGGLALMLATVGAFGVFAYMVEERRREIGVRMALGATSANVVRAVVGGVRRPLLVGLGSGLLLSMLGAQLLRSRLYGLSPFDPITYVGIAGILTVAALIATGIPARRATRIDPAITLRGD